MAGDEKKWYKDKTRLLSGFVGATVRRARSTVRAPPRLRRRCFRVFLVRDDPLRSRLAPFAARRPSRPRTSLARETCTPDSRGSTPPLAQVASAAIGAAYLIAKKKDDEDGE